MPRAFAAAERTQIRAALMDAARLEASRGTFRRTPVDALTRAAGISKGAFYLFFPSKQALLAELLAETETRLRARLGTAAHGPPDQQLRRVLHALFNSVAEHPLLSTLTDREDYAWLARSLPPGALAAARADDDTWSAGLVARLVAEGALDPTVSPTLFTQLGVVALSLASHTHLSGDQQMRATVDLLVDALAARLAPSRPPRSARAGC